MDIRKTRTCDRCKGQTPLDKVRLVPKNKEENFVLCEKCSKEFKERSSTVALRSTKIKPLPEPTYTKYRCTRCRYSFRVDTTKADVTHRLHCPYCGKSDQLENT